MSYYFGFRIKCTVKEEFRKLIKDKMKYVDVNDDGSLSYNKDIPDDLWNNTGIPEVQEFYDKFPMKSSDIPYNHSCDMTSYWSLDNDDMKEYRMMFDENTGHWAFMASSNYGEELTEMFIMKVIPAICSSVEYCEWMGEDRDISVLYQWSNDGLIINSDGSVEFSNSPHPTMYIENSRFIDYREKFYEDLNNKMERR